MMNKEQYIETLKKLLKGLPQEEIDDAIVYCEEYFAESESEAEAIKQLGEPNAFAKNIIGNSIEKSMRQEQPPNQSNRSQRKSSRNLPWMIILGILSLPLSLPLAIVAITLIFVFLVLLFVFMVIAFAGILVAVIGLVTAIWNFTADIPAALVLISISMVFIGIGLVVSEFVMVSGKKTMRWIGTKVSSVLKKEGNHEEVN